MVGKSLWAPFMANLAIGLLVLPVAATSDAAEPVTDSWRIVNYWSEWCAPCRVEIPVFNELSKELASSDVIIVGVNFDEDPLPITLDIAQELGIEFPTLTVEEVMQLGLRPPDVLPTTYILSSSNEIVAKLIGQQTKQDIVDALSAQGYSAWGK
ncbi:MAG: thiol-disulfide isomerase/thioredoxin [Pseudohongiellaceae bacterium]